jgi:hypothetical protein
MANLRRADSTVGRDDHQRRKSAESPGRAALRGIDGQIVIGIRKCVIL